MSKLLSQTDGVVTYVDMTSLKLTRLQNDVLGIVRECGPVTAADVAYHLPIGTDRARGVLARLEARKLVDAVYTGHGRSGRAFVAREEEGT